MQGMPPPRYKIVERGRRLITVDARTGTELGLSAVLGADPVFSQARPHSMTAAMMNAQRGGELMASTPRAAETAGPPRRGSALAVNRIAAKAGVAPANNAGRWVIVMLAALFAVMLIFSLYLWVPIALLLWFPATRPLIVDAMKNGWGAVRDWVNGG